MTGVQTCALPICGGQVLKVISTDPGSKRDFEAFARQTGHTLVRVDEADRQWTFFLKRR